MIIYKCIITDDEMFSDIYKIKETPDGLFYEVEGKMISRTANDFDDALIGANASAEEATESCESSTLSGVDIVLNHHLQEIPSYDKKSYLTYIKGYMKAIKARLEETNPDRVEAFQNTAQSGVRAIVGNLKNYQFFTGQSLNTDGSVGLLDFREDGITPFMLFFKDGLIVEKC